jgi:serine/threonine protein kinase
MSLAAGKTLGPYEIVARIGSGGMGEVYRAHDPRMRRNVAIKISEKRFSDRFSREVHAVAALNHPTSAISTTGRAAARRGAENRAPDRRRARSRAGDRARAVLP